MKGNVARAEEMQGAAHDAGDMPKTTKTKGSFLHGLSPRKMKTEAGLAAAAYEGSES
jgi:hypothetical protein